MKTKHLIEILRCPGDNTTDCVKCGVLESCKELAGRDIYEVCAERLEQLLENLRRTEAELKEVKLEAKMWERRYKHLFDDMRKAMHEQEILNSFGGD